MTFRFIFEGIFLSCLTAHFDSVAELDGTDTGFLADFFCLWFL